MQEDDITSTVKAMIDPISNSKITRTKIECCNVSGLTDMDNDFIFRITQPNAFF